jgi:hypothetical protein
MPYIKARRHAHAHTHTRTIGKFKTPVTFVCEGHCFKCHGEEINCLALYIWQESASLNQKVAFLFIFFFSLLQSDKFCGNLLK